LRGIQRQISIGQANKSYNFEEKFKALLSYATRSLTHELKKGFVGVPKDCYIQLEKKAADIILKNISQAFGNRAGIIARIETFKENE